MVEQSSAFLMVHVAGVSFGPILVLYLAKRWLSLSAKLRWISMTTCSNPLADGHAMIADTKVREIRPVANGLVRN